MSLNFSETLAQEAAVGEVDGPAFVQPIWQALPHACWGVAEKLAYSLYQEGEEWADYGVCPPKEQVRGQLLRIVGGDAMWGALDRHSNVKFSKRSHPGSLLPGPA